MQHVYVDMQLTCIEVVMQFIYVNQRHKFYIYVNMRLIWVNIHLIYVDMGISL